MTLPSPDRLKEAAETMDESSHSWRRNAALHAAGNEFNLRSTEIAEYYELAASILRALSEGKLVLCSNVVRVTQWKHTWYTGGDVWTTEQHWNGHTSNESQPLYAPATEIPT